MQRSISLDILKILLCVMVISAHLYPLFEKDSIAGWFIVNGYTRILVPCFLIINGYFLVNKIEDKKAVSKYLTHLLLVYIVWSTFYSYSYITWESKLNIAIFWLTGYHHLWYLPALLVGVVILYFFKRWNIKDRYLLIIAVILYPIGHQINLAKLSEPLSRNGLFYGYTFITIGYLIKKYNVASYFKTWHLVLSLIVAFLLVTLEASIYYDLDLEMNLFLSSFILAPSAIMLCLIHPLYVNKSTFTEYLSYIPTGVYYVHLFYVYKFYSVDYNIYNLPIIFLVSVLTVIPLVFINKRVKYIL